MLLKTFQKQPIFNKPSFSENKKPCRQLLKMFNNMVSQFQNVTQGIRGTHPFTTNQFL